MLSTEEQGFIYLHRKIWKNPIITKDAEHLAVWVWLLTNATHQPVDVMFGSERLTLKAGQLVTGRKKIAEETHVSESKVERILKLFEIEHQIEQQTNSKGRLISLINWSKYQKSEQRFEQQVNNKWTTSEQQVNTNNNKITKKQNNKINNKSAEQIISYLNQKTGSNYRINTKSTLSKINARLNEGFKTDDFIVVIDKKFDDWYGTEFEQYLRPDTLFGTKFESYLNQPTKEKQKDIFEMSEDELEEALKKL